jgi:hypothetical protein
MRTTLLIRFALVATVAAGCHYQAAPVPISGAHASIASLAGRWVGEYRGLESGRSGNIVFAIRVSGDSAFGDVLMFQPGLQLLYSPADSPIDHARHAPSTDLRAIQFVSVVNDLVSGALEPYVAPDCECTVRTTFIGRVRADTVAGTFETRAPGLPLQVGRWQVMRSREHTDAGRTPRSQPRSAPQRR